MATKTSRCPPSPTNNTNMENTRHGPTNNLTAGGTMAETQEDAPTNNKNRRTTWYHGAISQLSTWGKYEKERKNTIQKRNPTWENHLTHNEQQAIGKLSLKTHGEDAPESTTQQLELYACPTRGRKLTTQRNRNRYGAQRIQGRQQWGKDKTENTNALTNSAAKFHNPRTTTKPHTSTQCAVRETHTTQ